MQPYIVSIQKSKRKTLSLHCKQLNEENHLIIKSPISCSDSIIQTFVNEKKDWVNKQFTKLNQYNHLKFPTLLNDGKVLYFLGKPYKLSLQNHSKSSVFFNENNIVCATPKETSNTDKKKLLTQWYKQLAKDILTDRTLYYANQLKRNVKSITLKQQKTRWGSCSTLGNINLNWLLIKTPLFVINYVTLHECCHLVHMNHSKAFWNLVESHMPAYQRAKQWLNTHGHAILCNH